jgi:hypothetical protein
MSFERHYFNMSRLDDVFSSFGKKDLCFGKEKTMIITKIVSYHAEGHTLFNIRVKQIRWQKTEDSQDTLHVQVNTSSNLVNNVKKLTHP